jgi:hypothetical protein
VTLINEGLNSMSGSRTLKMDSILLPLTGGSISKEKSVLPAACLRCCVTFIEVQM